jgi:hypothetical protein
LIDGEGRSVIEGERRTKLVEKHTKSKEKLVKASELGDVMTWRWNRKFKKLKTNKASTNGESETKTRVLKNP